MRKRIKEYLFDIRLKINLRIGLFLCKYGAHRIVKGTNFYSSDDGCSHDERFDRCSRNGCGHAYYIKDEEGYKLKQFQLQMSNETRKVLIEKTSQEIKDLEYYLNENNWVEV